MGATQTRAENTGMPDEKSYVSYLLDYKTAVENLEGIDRIVTQKAYELWQSDAHIEANLEAKMARWKKNAEREVEERQRRAAQSEAKGEDTSNVDALGSSLNAAHQQI